MEWTDGSLERELYLTAARVDEPMGHGLTEREIQALLDSVRFG